MSLALRAQQHHLHHCLHTSRQLTRLQSTRPHQPGATISRYQPPCQHHLPSSTHTTSPAAASRQNASRNVFSNSNTQTPSPLQSWTLRSTPPALTPSSPTLFEPRLTSLTDQSSTKSRVATARTLTR